MARIKYSKRTSPIPLKRSTCYVILPRVDVNEILRERRRRSLSSVLSDSDSVVRQPVVTKSKRRFRVKKEPPCQFHSEININGDETVEIPGVLSEPRNTSSNIHDITRSMCYMCSPTREDKSHIWKEIRWHTPMGKTSNAPSVVPNPNSMRTDSLENTVSSRNVSIGIDADEIIVNDSIAVDQASQTVRHYSCKFCPAFFTDVAHLVHHKSVHQKSLECVFCPANFLNKNDLKSHLKLHMIPKYYECVFCPQIFKKKLDIKTHLALHVEQNQFHCLLCPAIFTQKNLLRQHVKTHSVSKFIHVFKRVDDETVVESRYQSEPESDPVSIVSSEPPVKTIEKPMQPEEMKEADVSQSKTFVNSSTSTASLNFFNCESCPLTFKALQAYKNHIKCHTRKNGKFICQHCNGKFKRNVGLILHMKASHTVD